MTAKEYLLTGQRFNVILEQKSLEKQYLQTLLESCFPQDKKNIVRLIGIVDAELFEVEEKKNQIISMVQGLKSQIQTKVLYKRYLEGKQEIPCERVAEELNYTRQYIVEVHGKALKAFEKIYQEELQKGQGEHGKEA